MTLTHEEATRYNVCGKCRNIAISPHVKPLADFKFDEWDVPDMTYEEARIWVKTHDDPDDENGTIPSLEWRHLKSRLVATFGPDGPALNGSTGIGTCAICGDTDQIVQHATEVHA
jgi:hypothetical protein